MWLLLSLSLSLLGNPIQAKEALPDAEREKLFHRAVDAARREGLDRRPEVQAEIDRLLYREFLKSRLSAHARGFEPTLRQLQDTYEKTPLIKIRHLAVSEKAPNRNERLKKIEQSKSTAWGEIIDFRGENQLPAPLYDAALNLKVGQFARIPFSGAEHLIQLLDKKPFNGAFPPYLEYLRGKLRQESEHSFLLSTLKNLREKS